MSEAADRQVDEVVPEEVMPRGSLPAMRYRDLPEPVPFRKMIGPGLILAGLALGSGEFILWPYITYKSQFVFFWACILGVATQYVLNMEVTRWTLATGESATTGFCRLGKYWAWIFLVANIVPWMLPAWAVGASEIFSWILWPPEATVGADGAPAFHRPGDAYIPWFAIGSMLACGIVLSAGPVIYNTVERVQMVLVTLVMFLVVVVTIMVVRPDAIGAQLTSTVTFGHGKFLPDLETDSDAEVAEPRSSGLDPMLLLGAIAFAGAGGTLNLCQSNYVKDKGYGMGRHIGRITSPITGQEEATSEVGYLFPPTEANLTRWRVWWRRASFEHFLNFFATCLICLVLLTLVSYSLLYSPDGSLKPEAEKYGEKLDFVLGEARQIDDMFGAAAKYTFLALGIVVLLTTEFGVLDAASRISADLVKVNWLQASDYWTESRLYYIFLWGEIVFGSIVLYIGLNEINETSLGLFKKTAAMNGGVMFLFSITLLILNRRHLRPPLQVSGWRMAALLWSILFFGFFACWAAWSEFVQPLVG